MLNGLSLNTGTNESRHRKMVLNMTYRDTQSQVHSKYKARYVRVTHRG